MRFIQRHWRLIIPIILMAIIFGFSQASSSASSSLSSPIANFFGVTHCLVRKVAHFVCFALLGASWYYYLRRLGKFTPGFTSLGSLLFVILYAFLDEFHQTFIPGRTGLSSDVLLDSIAGLTGIIIFASVYYLTRSQDQRTARRKQVDKIWANNAKLFKSLKKPHKK